jgi:DNA polymerase elongation subunit (family B)
LGLPDKEGLLKVAIFDIESSALEAVGAGFMLCAVVKPLGGKAKVFRYDESKDKPSKEVKMLSALIAELEKYDLIAGHNIRRFDLNFIKSRALVLGIKCNIRAFVFDTLESFRRCGFLTRQNGFGKPTASLAFVVDFLGIPQLRTGIYPAEHWKAVWQEGKERKEALDEIVDHCIKDVTLTESVFEKLFQIDNTVSLRRLR